jgi:uncharacterized protein YfaP (DUF2135 family)
LPERILSDQQIPSIVRADLQCCHGTARTRLVVAGAHLYYKRRFDGMMRSGLAFTQLNTNVRMRTRQVESLERLKLEVEEEMDNKLKGKDQESERKLEQLREGFNTRCP